MEELNENLSEEEINDQNNQENGNDSDDNENYNDISEGGWVSWFCQSEGNEFFIEIDESFIRDPVNHLGLEKFKNYKSIIEIILSPESPTEKELQNEDYIEKLSLCRDIYGLLHSRFISTPTGRIILKSGLALAREKYLNLVYGYCPRILCNKQAVLPIALSNELKYSRVRVVIL
jgi:casein kinase II subunit beta